MKAEGGGRPTPIEAQLGTSFADLAEGIQGPDAPEPLEPVGEPEVEAIQPDRAEETSEDTSRPKLVVPDADRSAIASAADRTPAAARGLPQVAVSPDVVDPAPDTAAPTTPDTISAEEPEQGVVSSSPRPSRRERQFERTQPPQRTAAETPAPQPVARSAPAADGGRQARAPEVGNAAVSTYPGQVIARLNRVRRPWVRTTGVASVAFSIFDTDDLSDTGLTRSSGSLKLDRAALNLVRRAGPYPPAPVEASRSTYPDDSSRASARCYRAKAEAMKRCQPLVPSHFRPASRMRSVPMTSFRPAKSNIRSMKGRFEPFACKLP
ncbi:outer membrane transport energization protein TonB [Palleronia aestuarii]|uniref:Outer membrane transport energization protein TonB n=1 Tax=Palleronia aestuarii TaxID=568105 RepID=A0A2W7N5X4_9RHOB|nr:outer membrane transport energization protein TonB [Palleronia aestuarii]